MAKKTKKGLDGRHRDTTGRIDKKHGNTRVKALRKTYGEHFAKGRRGDMMLKTLLAETGYGVASRLSAQASQVVGCRADTSPCPRDDNPAIRHPWIFCGLCRREENLLARSTHTDRDAPLRGVARGVCHTSLSEAPWGGSRPSGCCGR